jgi:septal ring-binding cell division protein DamX
MTKSYFLTRQTAKLLEAFVGDLKSGGGVYLLYGDDGVGKTRLLEELAQSRLQDVKVHWIDLKAGGSGEGAQVDSSVLIEDTFARAETGDVIIADHFEMALKKTRHQLLSSWSTDGTDKQISLIVAGKTSCYDELRQLAQQYQLRAQSFQQMPFSADEAEAFLGFYLFPDRPIGKLTVPPLLRNQISMGHGSAGSIVEIAERAGDQIHSEPLNDTESTRKGSRVIVGVLIAAVVILVVGWYFYGSSLQMGEVPIFGAESSVATQAPVQSSPEPAAASANNLAPSTAEGLVDKVADEVVDDKRDSQGAPQSVEQVGVSEDLAEEELAQLESSGFDADSQDEVQDEAQDEIYVQDATAPVDELGTTTPVADELQTNEVQDETATDDTVPASASQAEPAPAQAAISVELPSIQSQPGRLLEDFQASLEWINSRHSKVGTIQILLLSQNLFDGQVYYEYLDRLSEQGVDITKVRIFATYTGNQKMFSVVYGEYQNRGAASAAKTDLPQILQDTAPIGRSVGGLMEEIQRLEGKN